MKSPHRHSGDYGSSRASAPYSLADEALKYRHFNSSTLGPYFALSGSLMAEKVKFQPILGIFRGKNSSILNILSFSGLMDL